MRKKPTIEELYAISVIANPEVGINTSAVRELLATALQYVEPPVKYFGQIGGEMMQEALAGKHTFHASIDDFTFQKRIHDALRNVSTSPKKSK